jgi:2-phosphosulfolactate phosphatase
MAAAVMTTSRVPSTWLLDSAGATVDAASYLARVDKVGDGLREGVKLGYRGVHPDDVELCMAIDRFDFALAAVEHDDHLVLLKA